MHTGYLVISYWHLSARIFCSVNFSPTWRLSCSFIQKHQCRVMDLCTAAPVYAVRLRLSCSFVDQFPYAISFNRKTVKQRLPCLKLIVIFLIIWSVSHWALPPQWFHFTACNTYNSYLIEDRVPPGFHAKKLRFCASTGKVSCEDECKRYLS
jgi:hypothetical protein